MHDAVGVVVAFASRAAAPVAYAGAVVVMEPNWGVVVDPVADAAAAARTTTVVTSIGVVATLVVDAAASDDWCC